MRRADHLFRGVIPVVCDWRSPVRRTGLDHRRATALPIHKSFLCVKTACLRRSLLTGPHQPNYIIEYNIIIVIIYYTALYYITLRYVTLH